MDIYPPSYQAGSQNNVTGFWTAFSNVSLAHWSRGGVGGGYNTITSPRLETQNSKFKHAVQKPVMPDNWREESDY